MSEPSKAIFLSYASQDASAAQRICDALRAAGLEVWFDRDELRGGDAWDASIRRQIRECALFVPIISDNTQAREEGYFRREWNLAVARTLDMSHTKTFLLPVVIDSTGEAAARVPDRFREVQWTRLPGGEGAQPFAQRLRRLLGDHDAGASSHHATTTAAHSGSGAGTPSIAVLPFVNLSRDEENEYFADGLAEELLNVMTRIQGLRVAARTSSFSFKGKDADVPTIAARLGVATVLEGSVRKAGKRVRVAAQLINAADGYHLWSATYDRELDDIFAVQDDIAHAVVKELQANLLAGTSPVAVAAEVRAANAGRSVDAEAHRLRLQGRHHMKRGTMQDRAHAIGCFRNALQIDPEAAAAWADLANALYWRAASGGARATENFMAGYREAEVAADRALAREPNLPDALMAKAFIIASMNWDMAGCERLVRRALALAPGDAVILLLGGLHLLARGYPDEALDLARRATELDPLNDSAILLEARVHLYAGRPAPAETCCHRAIELNAQGGWRHGLLCLALLAQERIAEAEAVAQADEREEYRVLLTLFVRCRQKRFAEADRLLAEIGERWAGPLGYQLAQANACRGHVDTAFDWLERCYEAHDPGAHWALTDPLLAPLREDARWPDWQHKLGFSA